MRKLGRSPVPMAELLFRITGAEGKRLRRLHHPQQPSADGRPPCRGEEERPPNTGPEILSPAEWRALKAICKT